MGINHISLVGNVVRAPELRMTPQGIPVVQFQIAVSRPPRAEGQTNEVQDFIRVVAWRKLAETVNSALAKGDVVSVEGRLLTRSYEKNGQRRKDVEVEANSVETIKTGTSQPTEPTAEEPSVDPFADASPFDVADDIPF